jgi:hypothetical protein
MAGALIPAAAGFPTGRIFFWAGGLILVIVLAGFAVGRIRKWMRPGVQKSSAESWSLQDLRDLRRQGLVSEQEFETLKAAIIAKYQSQAGPAEKTGQSRDCPAE